MHHSFNIFDGHFSFLSRHIRSYGIRGSQQGAGFLWLTFSILAFLRLTVRTVETTFTYIHTCMSFPSFFEGGPDQR